MLILQPKNNGYRPTHIQPAGGVIRQKGSAAGYNNLFTPCYKDRDDDEGAETVVADFVITNKKLYSHHHGGDNILLENGRQLHRWSPSSTESSTTGVQAQAPDFTIEVGRASLMSPHSKSSNGRRLVEEQFLGKKPPFFNLTTLLYRLLPISAQNYLRDTGFRPICDGAVVLAAAVMAVFHPKLARRFLDVGRRRRDHRYGSHPRQVIEVVQGVQPSEGQSGRVPMANSPKLLVFVHGGVWASGSTWMYRLMVDRLSRLGYTVASIGYRVYPDADVNGQVDDIAAAIRWISDNIADMGFDSSPDVFLAGHSSGAHIAQRFLLRRAEAEVETAQKRYRLEVKGFIGLSARSLASQSMRGFDKETDGVGGLGWRLPRSLLVHGTADTTVPFFQTTAMAAALRALSVPTTVHLEPEGEHFDTIGDLMFKEGSAVETAILRFTSEEAVEKDRAERCARVVS